MQGKLLYYVTSHSWRPVVDRWPQHVVHPVRVQDEGRVGDVVLPCGLGQRQPLLEHRPGLKRK